MSRLRSYGPLATRSQKVEDGDAAFRAVYADVDARSEGRCEVWEPKVVGRSPTPSYVRCGRRAVEHHHLFQPRRSHHTVEEVVHICRACHDRVTAPFRRGRLCHLGRAGAVFLFAVKTANDKWEARRAV
jgi:hypothetical protein